MGIFTSKWKHLPDVMDSYGLVGTNANWDSVLGEWELEWEQCSIEWANYLIDTGVGEDRGYKIVNNIYYRLVYLPPPPHIQTYE